METSSVVSLLNLSELVEQIMLATQHAGIMPKCAEGVGGNPPTKKDVFKFQALMGDMRSRIERKLSDALQILSTKTQTQCIKNPGFAVQMDMKIVRELPHKTEGVVVSFCHAVGENKICALVSIATSTGGFKQAHKFEICHI